MKKAILALIAACALCCIPLFIPALAGLAVFGAQLALDPRTLEAILCMAALAVIVSAGVFIVVAVMKRRKPKASCGNPACAPSGSCGCK